MFHSFSGHLRRVVGFELSAAASCIQNKVHLINIVPELCSSSVNRFLLIGQGRAVLRCICTSSIVLPAVRWTYYKPCNAASY
jgi:hypothetical protein